MRFSYFFQGASLSLGKISNRLFGITKKTAPSQAQLLYTANALPLYSAAFGELILIPHIVVRYYFLQYLQALAKALIVVNFALSQEA